MTNLIQAVVVDPGLPERLVIREVELPSPLPHQAIARVASISLKSCFTDSTLTSTEKLEELLLMGD